MLGNYTYVINAINVSYKGHTCHKVCHYGYQNNSLDLKISDMKTVFKKINENPKINFFFKISPLRFAL